MKKIKKALSSPFFSLFIGLLFIIGGLSEIVDTYEEDLAEFNFHSHHAIFIYGIAQVLGSLADMLDGVQYVIFKNEDK